MKGRFMRAERRESKRGHERQREQGSQRKQTEKREQPKVCKEFYWQSTGGQNTQKTPAEEEKDEDL